MDMSTTTKNHVSYVFSRNVILKGLLDKGVITDYDFERYDQMLYDRYHMNIRLSEPRPMVRAQTGEKEIVSDSADRQSGIEYLSLTALAREKSEVSPGYLIQSWMRENNTVEFLHVWELRNNSMFNDTGYQLLLDELKTPSTTLTAKKWIKATGAIGLQSRLGKSGGTYAHPEIIYTFKAWLYPSFQYELIQNYMRSNSQCRGGTI